MSGVDDDLRNVHVHVCAREGNSVGDSLPEEW